jgi:hypothetical protein
MATPSPLDIYRPAQEMAKQEISNINPFGISSDPVLKKQYEESIEAQKKVADALAQRYANPNWGRISAALLKPQLGGFAASFGSAQEELGNYQEAERAAQPTIAQMRADVAKGMFTLAQQNKAAQIAEEISRAGFATPSQAAALAGFTQGSTGVAKAATEQESAAINQFNTKLTTAGSIAALISKEGAPYVNTMLPKVLAMYPELRNKYPDINQYLPSSGGDKSSSDKALALAENERKLRAFENKNEISPADKIEFARLNKERQDLGGAPIIVKPSNFPAQVSAPAQNQQNKAEEKKLDWANPNYPVQPPSEAGFPSHSAYLAQIERNREESVKNYSGFNNLVSGADPNLNFTGRGENLKNIARALTDKNIREYTTRGSPQELSALINAAGTSQTSPDALRAMLEKANFISPGEKGDKVTKFQDYVRALAREQQFINNNTANATNQKYGMEMSAGIQHGTTPASVNRYAMEELHKMQYLSTLAGLVKPYVDVGYSWGDALNSKRVQDFRKDWMRTHGYIGEHSDKFGLPTFLADPEALSPNYDYRKHRKVQ